MTCSLPAINRLSSESAVLCLCLCAVYSGRCKLTYVLSIKSKSSTLISQHFNAVAYSIVLFY